VPLAGSLYAYSNITSDKWILITFGRASQVYDPKEDVVQIVLPLCMILYIHF